VIHQNPRQRDRAEETKERLAARSAVLTPASNSDVVEQSEKTIDPRSCHCQVGLFALNCQSPTTRGRWVRLGRWARPVRGGRLGLD
jgi:hypothetical protein